MTDSLADRTHRAAVQMWEGNDCRGRRPTREDFTHLDASPAEVPDLLPPAPAPGREVTPAPLNAADAAAVKAALTAMQDEMRLSGGRTASKRRYERNSDRRSSGS